MAKVVVTLAIAALALGLEYLWGRFAYTEFFVKGRSATEVANANRLRGLALVLTGLGLALSLAADRLEASALQWAALCSALVAIAILFRATQRVGTGRALLAVVLVITGGALSVLAIDRGWLPGRVPFSAVPAGRMIVVTLTAGSLFLVAAKLSRPPQP